MAPKIEKCGLKALLNQKVLQDIRKSFENVHLDAFTWLTMKFHKHTYPIFIWFTAEKISIDLKKRIGFLRRIRNRFSRDKLFLIAEGIFDSKIRYGVLVYLNPVYNKEELKMTKIPKNTVALQTLQNSMIRVILGLKKEQDWKDFQSSRLRIDWQYLLNFIEICSYNIFERLWKVLQNIARFCMWSQNYLQSL